DQAEALLLGGTECGCAMTSIQACSARPTERIADLLFLREPDRACCRMAVCGGKRPDQADTCRAYECRRAYSGARRAAPAGSCLTFAGPTGKLSIRPSTGVSGTHHGPASASQSTAKARLRNGSLYVRRPSLLYT